MLELSSYIGNKLEEYSDDWTPGVSRNAVDLLDRVNRLLSDLREIAGYTGTLTPRITSGWRPASYNRSKKGATRSYHILGRAVDLADPDRDLASAIIQHFELLEVHDLWMEHFDSTPGWVHLDTGVRPARPIRVFFP